MPIIDPEGKYAAPKNVRVENGLLKWDSVEKAERYGIYAYLCDSNGTAVKLVDIAEMDSTETLEVPVDEIASFLELPTGNYRFAVKASSVHNGFWNATLESDLSKKTELVLVN
jgi:hypothetical protein